MRFGLRLLGRSPVFALTVSLLLGIGIGANTLIFSFFDALLLRPLPVPHPEQLVRLIEVRSNGFTTWDFPFELYEQLVSNASSLSEVLCQGDLDVAFKDGEATQRIRMNKAAADGLLLVDFASVCNAGYTDRLGGIVNFVHGPVITDRIRHSL